jgi:hypothetical protein
MPATGLTPVLAIAWRWSLERHHTAPTSIKRAIIVLLMIRALCNSPLLNMPNELMFLIFGNLGLPQYIEQESMQSLVGGKR